MEKKKINHLQTKEQEFLIHTQTFEEEYFGIIPSSKEMERYENICPGSADRILKMAEEELQHKRLLETKEQDSIIQYREKALEADISIFKLGQLFGFLLLFVSWAGGFYLVIHNRKVEGYITVVSTILFYFAAVIYRNKVEKKGKEEKENKIEKY